MKDQLVNLPLTSLRLVGWFLLLAAVFIPLELLFSQRRQPIFRRRWLQDFGFFFLNGLLPPLLLAIPISIMAALIRHIGPQDFYRQVATLPLGLRLLLAMVVGEIGGYWGHRWCHEVPILWQIHAVHHSAEQLDWLVNSRAHPFDFLITRVTGLLPVFLLGLAQPAAATVDVVTVAYITIATFWSYGIHANISWRFGWLEQLLATPAFHHWHHANDDPRHLNRNYAAMFPWVDRLFGTLWLPSRRWPASYGLLPESAPQPRPGRQSAA